MSAPNCTWVDCEKSAQFPQTAQDGETWANLCEEHHKMLESAMPSTDPNHKFEPGKMLSYWVKAQGGSKAAAKRMIR